VFVVSVLDTFVVRTVLCPAFCNFFGALTWAPNWGRDPLRAPKNQAIV
jgi:uncharacterized membrane protein YdfJ with MMPL/SSD domain